MSNILKEIYTTFTATEVLATCTDLTVTLANVGDNVSETRADYGSIAFMTYMPELGDEDITLVPSGIDPLTNEVWTASLTSLGVYRYWVFYVPKFGNPAFPIVAEGDIVYYALNNSFYTSDSVQELGTSPSIGDWTILDTPTLSNFIAMVDLANPEDEYNYYYTSHLYFDCSIEKKLSEILLEIPTGKHTSCTFDEYEMLRRKYEGAKAQFDLLNYTKAQELFEDTYNHLNSKNPC